MLNRRIVLIMIAGLCALFLFACGPKARKQEAVLDTPEHHVSNGNKLLERGKIDEALNEFNLAKGLDPKFAPAYVGIGLVHGYKNDFKAGMEAMDKAEGYAEGDEQELAVHIGFMRLYTLGGEKVHKKWLKKVESRFEKAIKLAPDEAAPYFYMGVGYKMSLKFNEAKTQFSKVLDLNKEFIEEANREFETIQKIERAMPGTKVEKIALLDKITRGDVCALFIEELKVDELFRNRTKKEFDTSFKGPEKEFKTGEYVNIPDATDIENHVLKTDIIAFIDLGIKGLEAHPDHTFQPYKFLTRAEFAMLIQDILIKITHDESLSTKFIGSEPPFPDVRSDQYFFNAVVVCTTRGIMKAKDLGTGEFDPLGTVSGAEALLSIRELKVQLSKY